MKSDTHGVNRELTLSVTAHAVSPVSRLAVRRTPPQVAEGKDVMRQIEEARRGNVTAEMESVAREEHLRPEEVAAGVAEGTIVILKNNRRNGKRIVGVGKELRTKSNANIGTSRDACDVELELRKLDASVEYGADTVMDLSTGGDLVEIRRKVLERSPVPVGSVPIYQAAVGVLNQQKAFSAITPDELFSVIEENAADGMDFMTVHCGVTQASLGALRKQGRVLGVISRGGALLVDWMIENDAENPLYAQYDRLLDLALEYDVTLSLGDGMRPGCIADATDRAQLQELIILGDLAKRALERGVQVMIEGPGHIPLHQIAENIRLEKEICKGAPFFVLGPLVTDIAPGYDHITSAIGGAFAAWMGADFLCYVTPAEHLRLPTIEDVREGVIAARIAAHAGDIAKGIKGASEKDLALSRLRQKRDWPGQIAASIDPQRARSYHDSSPSNIDDACSMCSELCSIRLLEEKLRK
jgi:phosphomethylpyrimidine synthase